MAGVCTGTARVFDPQPGTSSGARLCVGSPRVYEPQPGTSSGATGGGGTGLPRGPTKRLCLSERILFAKNRLNRVSQRKKLLIQDVPDDWFAEQTDLADDLQLLEAAKAGKDSKVKLLISQGASSDFVDENGRSALHWAAEYGYMRVVYPLIEAGWDINLEDNRKHTPLHVACDHHNGNIAACLISHGCKFRTRDLNGNTPLHRAIRANLETISCMLCNLGADMNAKNNSGWTPIHEATRIGNENLARKLMTDGADLTAITDCKSSPFLTAIFYYKIAHRSSYTCLEPILSMLIDHGCQLSYYDGQWDPLTSAISVFNSRIAAKLIYHGCILPEVRNYNRSVLVEAFTKCDDYVIKLMVNAGYLVTPDEVEQCARRIPTFSLSFLRLAFPGYNGKGRSEIAILRYLKEKASQPFSLQEICRKSIRVGLNKASGDTTIVDRIPKLPLPTVLKHFIALREFDSRK